MPIPGEQPDLTALPPETSPVKRRLAAQYVREARDRLTSSSGTRPAFDYELLRQYAQNRLSASLVILLAGRHHRLPVEPVDRRGHRRRLDRLGAGHPRRHGHQMPAIPRPADGRDFGARLAAALHHARPVLRAGLDVHPDPSGRRRRKLEHLHAVRHAAGGGGLQHAGLEPADGGVCRHLPGHRRDRARLRPARHAARLHPRHHGDHRAGLFRRARLSALFDHAGDAGGARRKRRPDRRARTGESDFRRGAAARGSRQHLQVALPRADEPRIAHAAQRHPRLLRSDEDRSVRRARGAGLQGIFRRHP